MKQELTFQQFVDEFKRMNRDTAFTYEGLRILYDHLEDVFEGEYSLDVIGLCCEFAEYTEPELVNDYGLDNTFKNMNEDLQDKVIGWTDKTVILHN